MSMFRKWGHNDLLILSQLRQKTITLLSRLSDIAPQKGFKRKQIEFKEDCSMVIQFFGTKFFSYRSQGTDKKREQKKLLTQFNL